MKDMKAWVAKEYGDDRALECMTLSVPEPAPDELLVKVVATTVNRTDTGILSGKPAFARLVFGLKRPKRQVPGTEFAGIVEAIGSQRSDFEIGDRVFGFHDEGTSAHAQYLTTSSREAVALIPNNLTFEAVAGCSEGTFYALNLLRAVSVQEGARILINGISGSIGSSMLQLLKPNKVYVVGVCSAEAEPRLLEMGADKIYDYAKTDFRDHEQEPFDFILDTVGNIGYRQSRAHLSNNGTYASTELGPWSQNALYAILSKLLGNKKAVFPIPRDVHGCQQQVLTLLANSKYQALIDSYYAFENINTAYKYVAQGKKTGNVIVTFDDV